MNGRATLLAASLVLAACEQQAAPPPSRHWTMFDFKQASIDQAPALEGFPAGFDHRSFANSAVPEIPVARAFTEGGFSPYVTTNVWTNFPEVWIQPMYILVTDWDAEKHEWKRVPGAPWIYTVGPKSRFHSPFWRVYWARVGAKTDYTSAEELLRDQVPLVEGPGWLASIVPDGTVLGPLPTLPFAIPDLQMGLPRIRPNDYLDGQKVTAIDFGPNRFEWNDELDVIEQPLFVLIGCHNAADCKPSGAPNIGGTGPLFERRPAILPNGRPRFGSYWRLYFVKLPEGTPGIYVPADAEGRTAFTNGLHGLAAPPLGFVPSDAIKAEVAKRSMQVALNAEQCFKDEAAFGTCRWLDSQKAIEEALPHAVKPTHITVNCPFLAYDGKDVRE